MSETLFIADLHLDGDRPGIIELFCRFLDERARNADALYILGDLFEYWIGDDDPAPHLEPVIEKLTRLADTGVPMHFQHGNRDFLAGKHLAATCRWQSLPERAVVELYGVPTLIMHGDLLCTSDHEYMSYRATVRDPRWQAEFLAQNLDARHAQAARYRELSRESTQRKRPEITDVDPDAVTAELRAANVTQMIHGHTHRPAIHEFDLDGRPARRIVLGDWYEHGSVLSYAPDSLRLEIFS